MYFPIGWPRFLHIPQDDRGNIRHIACNRDRILFVCVTDDSIGIWYVKPSVLIVNHQRCRDSIDELGVNLFAVWKSDSSMLAVVTSRGHIVFYSVNLDKSKTKSLYTQADSKVQSLQRESAELFIKGTIPAILLTPSFNIKVPGGITSVVNIRDELMVATETSQIERYQWNGRIDLGSCLELQQIPFSIDQQYSIANRIEDSGIHAVDVEYSPILGGFAIVLSNGKAALLTAPTLAFEPNDETQVVVMASSFFMIPPRFYVKKEVKGLWAHEVNDATCTAVNHKYLLIAYGKENGQIAVCHIDEVTGGLQISHKLLLSNKDYPDASMLGPVTCARWTPDGCALLVAWQTGGFGMWSVYGALLFCSLGWDCGINQDLSKTNPLLIESMPSLLTLAQCWKTPPSCMWKTLFFIVVLLAPKYSQDHHYMAMEADWNSNEIIRIEEWGMEGYQLWMALNRYPKIPNKRNSLAQLNFVKSVLTVNPCMSNHEFLVLQGEDRLYINAGRPVAEVWKQRIRSTATFYDDGMKLDVDDNDTCLYSPNSLLANKQWVVLMIPSAYNSTNWPIRYVAVDKTGKYAAIAGRTGVAHSCLQTKKWKLFGNETQEKDFVVTGGLLWWQEHVVMGCYNIQDDRDEIRLYPRESKLDNSFVRLKRVTSPVLLLNLHRNKLVAYFADCHIEVYAFVGSGDPQGSNFHLMKEQDINISNFSVHPVCITHIILVTSRGESQSGRMHSKDIQSILVNVCGKVVMFQMTTTSEKNQNNGRGGRMMNPIYVSPTVLASNVENIWVSSHSSKEKKHLLESLLFGCGAQGMKIWLPLFPRDGEKPHNFMSKWIMLPLNVSIYPLTVLFEDAVVLGAENDTVLYPAEPSSLGTTHPFCIVGRTSQVYLHHILRQLLRRNLGFHAWEIARSCTNLSYFPHALELLLHEVLEEEATSKEPIPDALLPRVVEFIREFPVYLQTIVQCARKIEIALWPYLFSTVGQPHRLFQECLQQNQLATGASYLIILQNLEPSSVSRQYATRLLDAALDRGEWNLCRDLVRFLKAIDPSDVESPPRSGFAPGASAKYSMMHPTPPVSPSDEISFVLGTMQVPRARTFSIPKITEHPGHATNHKDVRTTTDSKAIPICRKSSISKDVNSQPEEFFLDVILQRHAKKLLSNGRLRDLGCFAAHLDFHLVAWLRKERLRAAKVGEFIIALKKLHHDFQWPFPVPPHPMSYYLQRRNFEFSDKSFLNNLPTLEDKMKGLVVDADLLSSSASREEIVDSGYLSHSGTDTKPAFGAFKVDTADGQTLEAHLRPHGVREDESIRTLDLSEDSSLWGDGEQTVLDDSSWNGLSLNADIEQMSAELASKGPMQSEVQLRYLLQLMMEANCLEWAVLISVVLRDAMAVIRIVNAARANDIPKEVTTRLKDGLASLEQWADKECLGYKRFMHTICSQSVALSKITCSKLRIRSPSPTGDLEMDSTSSSANSQLDVEPILLDVNQEGDESQETEDELDKTPVAREMDENRKQQLQDNNRGIECTIS